MKPSGIEWIGDIPDDWEVRRLKAISKLQTGNTPSTNNKNNYAETGFPWLKPDDLCGTIKESQAKVFLSPAGKLETRILPANSILLCCIGSIGKIGFVSTECASNQQITALIIKHGFWRYFLYVLRIAEEELMSLSVGNVVFILNSERLGSLKIPFPPLKTQRKIADYLDEECREIDATIAKQKESIEKLKAYKQSLISETVTKGLDKSAPLKPSGIEWIGDIPAHWEVKRIKELFSFGKGLPISKEDLIENGVPVINYGQIHSKDNNGTSIKDSLIRYVDLNYKNTNMTSLVESGDFIFADTSEDLDGCGNCIYVDSKYPIFAGYHCIILRSIKRNSSKYLAYLFHMDAWRTQIRRNVTGVKVFSISKKILGKSYLLFPPRYEQECIVDYLHEKCNEIDVIINKKQNIIQKLDAYKKSLIFECVTGKQIT